MLESNIRGYAVIDPKSGGIAFASPELDRCKYFCRKGYVVVEAIPKKRGFNLCVMYHPSHPWFKKYYRSIYLFKTHFSWAPVFVHEYGTEVIYKPEDDERKD